MNLYYDEIIIQDNDDFIYFSLTRARINYKIITTEMLIYDMI